MLFTHRARVRIKGGKLEASSSQCGGGGGGETRAVPTAAPEGPGIKSCHAWCPGACPANGVGNEGSDWMGKDGPSSRAWLPHEGPSRCTISGKLP